MLCVELNGNVLVLRLNVPNTLNALTLEMLESLITSCQDAESDPAVGAVVLAGAGRAFCSGWNRRIVPDSPAETLAIDARGGAAVDTLMGLSKPVVAALHGAVVGGGVMLAAACDLRLAADDTYFWLPEVALGTPVLWRGLKPLAAEIGLPAARHLALTADRKDVQWALRVGLVQERVVEDRPVEDAAVDVAQRLAAFPGHGVSLAKQDLGDMRERIVRGGHGFSAKDVFVSLSAGEFVDDTRGESRD
ncbi:enoyl-CoA hydratase/isomerase family protein [Nocardioides terrisoli]|uniref:enoyl-CoA hydratase/isomerase family protein n=1 Tax=Nocardioides terrisoli TaxID=3388267 RepID=UPI00287B80B3|nr:enoyl-CoA hydratase/isomerase family protein [Nocardioides marmorisolisilvae]